LRPRPPAATVVALALAAAGCGGSESPSRSERASPPPPLCGALSVRATGRVDDPAARELSGLVASRTRRGVLWAHNDSGDAPRVLALRADGRLLGSFTVTGARAVDWEDIAAGPAPGGRGADLYAGDIGDNDAARATISVYRFPEPDARSGGGPTAPAAALELRYPDGAHDAEALLVDPLEGDLAVVTKELVGDAGVYVARARSLRPGRSIILRRTGAVALGLGRLVTAGDVSPDGRTIALRSYDRLFVWRRPPGESLARTLGRAPCASPTVLDEPQGEALALIAGGAAALTVTEGARPAVRRYAPRRPS
jgi:hypothetical protein